jgi:chromosome partitioning protein
MTIGNRQRRVCVASQKGGVGKTTVVLNLAYSMAKRGWRTLVVDTDPQGGIGLSLSRRTATAPGLAQLLTGTAPLESVVIQTKLAALAVLPVGRLAMQDTPGFGLALASGEPLISVAAQTEGRFDLVMFDTPSGFQGVTLGAMRASHHVLSPVQAEPLAARSLAQLLEVIGALRSEGVQLDLLGIVLTMLQTRVDKSLAVADELWAQLGERVFQTSIPRDPAFLEASAAGVPLGLLSRRPSAASSAFEQLASEVEARLQLVPTEESYGPVSLVD